MTINIDGLTVQIIASPADREQNRKALYNNFGRRYKDEHVEEGAEQMAVRELASWASYAAEHLMTCNEEQAKKMAQQSGRLLISALNAMQDH